MDDLLLDSKNDIPFVEAQLFIHQPVIKDIALIGEKKFFTGCEYLTFSKDKLNEEDKIHLTSLTDFEVLMTILKDNNIAIQESKVCMEMVLFLMFPDYRINFLPLSIMLSKKVDDKLENHLIDKDNFESFKNIVSKMFCLNDIFGKSTGERYNPEGPQASALVKKFKERERKIAELRRRDGKGTTHEGFSVFDQYLSTLAVGNKKDKNVLLQYTVYQLVDEYRRFRKKIDFDLYVKAKMAGAKDIEDVDNWMGDIHSENFTGGK